MKKVLTIIASFLFVTVGAGNIFAKDVQPAKTLPVVIAQSVGQANTVVMWHDIDNDGKADYKAAYVFENGKLHQLSKSQFPRKATANHFNER